MAGAAHNKGNSRQDYETPSDLMQAIIHRFGRIGFDLAASAFNRKAPYFFDISNNSLLQDWNATNVSGWLWLNPPFANIAPWARKCSEESKRGAEILFLVPAAVGSNWWANYVHKIASVHFLNGRVAFDPQHPTWGYPKDCALCIYSPKIIAGYDVWTWKPKRVRVRK